MKKSNTQLLVVDDSASMRRRLCELLHELGFANIHEAANGAVALDLFQRTPYDVVITDWYMPYATGIDLLRAIRGGAQRSATPVLVLTGNVTMARIVEAIEAGANGFVTKPFVAHSLSEKVLRLVAALPPVTEFEPPMRSWGRRA
ncbi:MAG: response regulator [Archangium sp.]|nr:response regulator [Archangium sp.]